MFKSFIESVNQSLTVLSKLLQLALVVVVFGGIWIGVKKTGEFLKEPIQLPQIEMPKIIIEAPEIALPKIELPKFELPEIELPEMNFVDPPAFRDDPSGVPDWDWGGAIREFERRERAKKEGREIPLPRGDYSDLIA